MAASLPQSWTRPLAASVNQNLSALQLPSECVIVAIIRKNQLLIPHGDTVLQPADEVLALVHTSQLSQLATLLGPKEPILRA